MRQASEQEAAADSELFPNTEAAIDFAAPKSIAAAMIDHRRTSLEHEDRRASTRRRRLLLALVAAFLYLLGLTVFYEQGMLSRPMMLLGATGISLAIGACCLMFA